MKNKPAVLISSSLLFIPLIIMGITGLNKGIETHSTLRIVMASFGLLIFALFFTALMKGLMKKTV
jgi:choline-glycine betaine transporter